ncbi:putative disease resistance protein [Camellia lanceoleosa]|nr:putative disease resistance protein [Camellia lanceoleosa]
MEDNNPELKVWVKQVREAAYDIGDVLELYMLRLGHRHGAGFRGFLRKVSCFLKTLKARHQIASEVQRMKSRVIDISKGHQRYHDRYGMSEQGSSSRSTGLNTACHDYRGDALLLDESELVGIDKPKSQLIRWLVHEDPRLKVFSVSGMGGLGKTTLVKKVFDDAAVKNHFQSHPRWLPFAATHHLDPLHSATQLLHSIIRSAVARERFGFPDLGFEEQKKKKKKGLWVEIRGGRSCNGRGNSNGAGICKEEAPTERDLER